MGKTTPITKADITKIQSRLENRKKVCTIYDSTKTNRTTINCANSIPKANSNKGISFSELVPGKIDLK